MSDVDAIIIGSGAGGMATAVALARAGMRVAVFERHTLPGGWCHTFNLGGFDFSPGVHYIGELGPQGAMRRIYEGLGVSETLSFLELNPDGYDQARLGGHVFDIPKGRDVLEARLVERFPSDADGIRDVLRLATLIPAELQQLEPRSAADALALPWRARHALRYGAARWAPFVAARVKDPLAQAILSVQGGDHGVPASEASVALHASIMAHYFDGGWYPKGGARAIPKAFIRQLRAHGGSIQVGAPVHRVLIREGRAVGVELEDGTNISAPVVVSNAEPSVTWGKLVPREHQPTALRRRMEKARWSISAISLFFATDLDLRAAGLSSANVWYSDDLDPDTAHRLVRQGTLTGDEAIPAFFLTTTTLKEPYKRRDGMHTCEAFAFVSGDAFAPWASSEHGARPASYEDLKRKLADRFFEAIERVVPSLREHVVFHSLGTPLTNTHYLNATRGNLYGTHKSLRALGPMGFPIHTHLPGLYQVGQSTVSHGIAGVTQSGLLAASAILKVPRSTLSENPGPPLRIEAADPR